MGLVQSVLEGMSRLRADAEGGSSGAPAPWDDYWYCAVGAGSSTGMRITADTVKRIACVYACVGVIGKLVASFPLGIYREFDDGGKDLAPKHPIHQLIATRPNAKQTSFEWRQMMQGHLELRGNAYSEIILDGRGWPIQLLPLHPDKVMVEIMRDGRLRYKYNDPLTNQVRVLLQEEVFHLRNWSDDGYVGQSTVSLGADVFGVALAAQEYSARFFGNDARPGGIIEGANFKNKVDQRAFRDDWQEAQSGRNRHKIAVLPHGLSFKEIGVKPSDAQLLDARKFSRIEICSMFGVPPHLIGETEKTATYASVEQFNIMFATECLWPRLVNWEQTLHRDLIQDDRYIAKFSMAALMRGDTAARYGAYQIAIQNGWLSQNDVRLMEGLNPIADGDKYWRPANWAELGATTQPLALPGEGETDPTQSPDDGGGEQAVMRHRLLLLASSSADRCMRKELEVVRKLAERSAEPREYEGFYDKHAGFVAEVLHIPQDRARQFCSRRLQELALAADPHLVVDQWARTGARELANLAVGELKQ